jgi:hypothetical protein
MIGIWKFFCDCALWWLSRKVLNHNCGNETEVLRLECEAWSNVSLLNQQHIVEWSRNMVWIDFFDTVHHFEEQRKNMISCSIWWKASDTEINAECRQLIFGICILQAVLSEKMGWHTRLNVFDCDNCKLIMGSCTV